MGMMVGAVATSANAASKYPSQLAAAQAQLDASNAALDDYKKQYTALQTAQSEEIETIKEAMLADLRNVQTYQTQLASLKKAYAAEYQNAQVKGIILLVGLAFILILKKFKIFEIFQ
jgi:Skp family chaperone for outer membrane proteins